MKHAIWIVEGPRQDVPGTDEVEWDYVELHHFPDIATAFEAYRLANLPGNPSFGDCRITRIGPEVKSEAWEICSERIAPATIITYARSPMQAWESACAWSGVTPPFAECRIRPLRKSPEGLS